jgi:hypothetical protein
MRYLKHIGLFLVLATSIKAQYSSDTIVLNELPDTIFVQYFSDFNNFEFAYAPGNSYNPDTLFLYLDTTLVSSIALPKTSVSTISESITTTLHNGSGYELDNGFGVESDFGYYLKQNADGSIQLNDWTQSISGDSISTAFGNQAAFEFVADSINQRYFIDPGLNTTQGSEIEVYHNGLRLSSTEYLIDTVSNNGIILNVGIPLGDRIIIDID